MNSETQPVAAQMSAIDTLLNHSEATPSVEWALTPKGHFRPREKYASAIASTNNQYIFCFVTGDPLVQPTRHTKSCSDCMNRVECSM